MRLTAIALLLVLGSYSNAQAAVSNQIANLCQDRWPADKGVQSYCIKVNRDYHDWTQYIRKRVFRDEDLREAMDECRRDYAPDYRQVSDCYWDEVK